MARMVSFGDGDTIRGDPGAYRARADAIMALRRDFDRPVRTMDDAYIRARAITLTMTNYLSRHPGDVTDGGMELMASALTAMKEYIDAKRERHLELGRRYTTTDTYPRPQMNRVDRLFSQLSSELSGAIQSLGRASSAAGGREAHLDSALEDANRAFSTLRELEPEFSRSVGYLENAIERRKLTVLMLKLGTAAGGAVASIATFGLTGSMLTGALFGGGMEAAGGGGPGKVALGAVFGAGGNVVPMMRVGDFFRKSVDTWNEQNRAAVSDGTRLDLPPYVVAEAAIRRNLDLIQARQAARLTGKPRRA